MVVHPILCPSYKMREAILFSSVKGAFNVSMKNKGIDKR